MCSNIRLSRSKSIKSGAVATYRTSYISDIFERSGVFGLNGGIIYNIRSERRISATMTDDVWMNKHLHRGVISILGFTENGNEFTLPGQKPMYAAILYNDEGEFALLTENSSGIVGRFHRRMPVLIEDNYNSLQSWFDFGRVTHLNPQALQRA